MFHVNLKWTLWAWRRYWRSSLKEIRRTYVTVEAGVVKVKPNSDGWFLDITLLGAKGGSSIEAAPKKYNSKDVVKKASELVRHVYWLNPFLLDDDSKKGISIKVHYEGFTTRFDENSGQDVKFHIIIFEITKAFRIYQLTKW